jgi:hypothetical protein
MRELPFQSTMAPRDLDTSESLKRNHVEVEEKQERRESRGMVLIRKTLGWIRKMRDACVCLVCRT